MIACVCVQPKDAATVLAKPPLWGAIEALWCLQVEPKKMKRRGGSETTSEALRASLNIIVAEDNLVNQRVVQKLLNSTGYLCELVSDGKKAVEKVRSDAKSEKPVDIILMVSPLPLLPLFRRKRRAARDHVVTRMNPYVTATTAGFPDAAHERIHGGRNNSIG